MSSVSTATPALKDRAMGGIAKIVGGIHVALYRLTGGKIGQPFRGGTVLLLTTTGRKSGKTRTRPVMYFEDGDDLIVVASNGGLARNSAWYYNLRARPEALVQVGPKRLRVRAEEARGAERERLWELVLKKAPFFAGYRTSTRRQIPIMILRPIAGA